MGAKVEIDGNGNIVIQKAEGSTITINPAIPEDVRKALIDHQYLISELPNKFLKMLMENNAQQPPVIGANVYLGLNLLVNNGIRGIAITVQITNLTKEIRFYNKPFFKVSVPINMGADTFVMTNIIGEQIKFPRKMEYGEVISEGYLLVPENIQLFEELLAKDVGATLTAYVSTTLGEVYMSNSYPIRDIVGKKRYIR
ncbi:MAG: hypothetical protein IJ534_01810 [Bacteroidaceae bacterium]|nr:hypothetical protein [Bacteroidaceae bacterium]